jgi:hypothetical protein
VGERSSRRFRRVLVAGAVLSTMALPVASAQASSGEFTRAEANADWTLGSVAGSAQWDNCEFEEPGWVNETELIPGHCGLQAFVTIGPDSGQSGCSAPERQWPHSSEQLALAWASEEIGWSGSASFDRSEISLSGVADQLACLSLLESYWMRPACQVYPQPGEACPQFIAMVENYSVLASARLAAPPPPPPVNTEAPQLAGTPEVGQTLTCSTGAWTNDPTSFAYGWLLDGNSISGQTAGEYIIQSADAGHQLSCEVTATNGGGSASAVSEPLAVLELPPPGPPADDKDEPSPQPPPTTQPGTPTAKPHRHWHRRRHRCRHGHRRRHRGHKCVRRDRVQLHRAHRSH